MKIAVAIFKYFPFGGLQNDMLLIARCAASRGHDVTVFTSEWRGEHPDGIRISFLPRRGFMNCTRAEAFEQDFSRALEREVFDCTITFNRIGNCGFYFAGDLCLASAWKNKSFLEKMLPRCRIYLRQERNVLDGNTHIFYIAPAQKKEYQACYGIPDSRFTELPPGLDVRYADFHLTEEERLKKRSSFGIAPDEIMLLLAASNPVLKGLDRLLKAVGALPDEWKNKCRIFCAGADFLPGIRAQSSVIFGGARSDMPEVYACADFLVHPARAEAAGNVLLESICCGTPVIASGVCGFAPYVRDSGGIVLDEPFSQEQLSAVLEKALKERLILREKVRLYSGKKEFFRRAETCVSVMEQLGRRKER